MLFVTKPFIHNVCVCVCVIVPEEDTNGRHLDKVKIVLYHLLFL